MNNTIATNGGDKVFKDLNNGGPYYYDDMHYRDCEASQCDIGNGDDNADPYGYVGAACMNVGDFIRYFKIDSVRGATNVNLPANSTSKNIADRGTIKENTGKEKLRYGCNFTSTYGLNCGSGSSSRRYPTPNFTVHYYYFKSSSGAKSNEVALYTRYDEDCGY